MHPGSRLLAVPTSAGAISLLLSLALGTISLRASNLWLLLVGCALLAPVLVSQLLRPELTAISISLRRTDSVAVGDSLRQVFHIHNGGRRSTPGFRLLHSHPGFAPTSLAVPGLAPGAGTDLAARWIAVARTVSDRHDLRLSSTAPFGMASYSQPQRLTAKISVHPAPGPVAELFDATGGDQAGGRPTRFGQELHELREWHRGDALRQVHWRATARHGRLTVVVPEATRQSRVAFVVVGSDHDSAAPGDQAERWEALLSTTAWTALDAVAQGQGVVRLSAAGAVDYIGTDAAAILDWFAGLHLIRPPTLELLQAAAAWADAAGVLVVASTSPIRPAGLTADAQTMLLDPDGRLTAS